MIEFSDEQAERYFKAMHAMQTGVATMMHHEPGETQPKHLRVGVNSAMIETSALAQILVDKGVCTAEEYAEALTVKAEAEAEAYTARVRAALGTDNVTLR